MKKIGLSRIAIILIIAIPVLASIGIVLIIIQGSSTPLDKSTINLDIKLIYMYNDAIEIKIERNQGKGNLLEIMFILSDDSNSDNVLKDTNMNELEQEDFIISNDELTNVKIDDVKEISIIPITYLENQRVILDKSAKTYPL